MRQRSCFRQRPACARARTVLTEAGPRGLWRLARLRIMAIMARATKQLQTAIPPHFMPSLPSRRCHRCTMHHRGRETAQGCWRRVRDGRWGRLCMGTGSTIWDRGQWHAAMRTPALQTGLEKRGLQVRQVSLTRPTPSVGAAGGTGKRTGTIRPHQLMPAPVFGFAWRLSEHPHCNTQRSPCGLSNAEEERSVSRSGGKKPPCVHPVCRVLRFLSACPPFPFFFACLALARSCQRAG